MSSPVKPALLVRVRSGHTRASQDSKIVMHGVAAIFSLAFEFSRPQGHAQIQFPNADPDLLHLTLGRMKPRTQPRTRTWYPACH